jgi:DNA repair exonuclease SbcCD nuclease subunit
MKLDNIRNIYLLGDLHIGVRNNSNEWFDIQREFLIDWFIPKIIADGFDTKRDVIIQAGDWNHVRESSNIRIANKSLEIFKIFNDHFERGVHIILGNHDVYYKDRTDVHSLKEIPLIYDNIFVYEQPMVLNINNKHKLLMLPWEHDVDQLSRKVASYVGKADYIVCHADIKDFRLNKWVKLEHGLNKNELKSFKKIWSGHIHTRQEHDNMTYIGTPYQLDRGDHGNTKGYYKLNVEGTDIIEEFVENVVSPKFVKYKASEILNKSLTEVKEMFNNNFVDILISSELAKVFPITQFIELVKDSGHRLIEFYPYKADSSEEDHIELDESYEYNIFEVLHIYLKTREIPLNLSAKVSAKFKEVHDNIKNAKNYYE